jgi:hypothetical protein
MNQHARHRLRNYPILLILAVSLAGCATVEIRNQQAQAWRSRSLAGTFGTYDAEPRKADGRVNVDRLVAELIAIKANTYNFLIWRAPKDWDDLKLFLPKARAKNIKVWVTIVPPSESPPRTHYYSEPFRLDYQRWAVEIAKLSLAEPNLVAWSVDDFSYPSSTFNLEYITRMVSLARRTNPKLAFVPCLYYRHITPKMGLEYRPLIDGILFPYRHEAGELNLTDWDTLHAEIAQVRSRFGSRLPVIVDVYATKLARSNDSTAEYVENVMNISRQNADGVLIFCHQYADKNPAKYQVIKKLFLDWASQDAARVKAQN